MKALYVNVPANATEGDGGVEGAVTIPSALGNDLVVSLLSSDTTEITVPAGVTIATGLTSATFDMTIVDDEENDGTQTVTITASAGGWTSANEQIDIIDNEPLDDCPDCSGDDPVVTDLTFKAGMDCEYVGNNTLTIGQGVKIEKDATVIFKAPKVKVMSGFHAEEGSTLDIRQP